MLTCSNDDKYFTCPMEDRIAAGLSKPSAKSSTCISTVSDHILKEDDARDPAVWNQALPFSTQLQNWR